MTMAELIKWLDAEIQSIDDRETRFSQAKRPMKLTRGQEIERSVLQRVRNKIGES